MVASALILAGVLGGIFAESATSAEHTTTRLLAPPPSIAVATHTRTTAPVVPRRRPARAHRVPPVSLAQRLAAAAQYGRRRGLRVGIAVADMTGGAITQAGDPGTFGTGSVIKVIVAAKMLLTGSMTGADERLAWEMVIGSNDDDCNILWEQFGGPDIITWVGSHYGIHIGYPNERIGFWGDTQTTAPGLAAFYLIASHDPTVWPWLSSAMAHAKRVADDGTDQYFGIPDAGGGHVVKQGWATESSGDGFQPDATVNSTGIITIGTHRYAVVILTEGHANDAQADSRGLVHTQAAAVTAIAAQVLDALRQRAGSGAVISSERPISGGP